MRAWLITFAAVSLGAFLALVQPWQLHAQGLGGNYGLVQGFDGGSISAPVLFPNGTSALPSMAFASEPTLGWYRSASGTMALGVDGGSEFYFSISGANNKIKAEASQLQFDLGGTVYATVLGDSTYQVQLSSNKTKIGSGGVDGSLYIANNGATVGTLIKQASGKTEFKNLADSAWNDTYGANIYGSTLGIHVGGTPNAFIGYATTPGYLYETNGKSWASRIGRQVKTTGSLSNVYDSDTWITNEGATARADITLWDGLANSYQAYTARFAVLDTDGIKVIAQGSETIMDTDGTSSAGNGYICSTTIGSTLEVVQIDTDATSIWLIVKKTGTWNALDAGC